MGCLHRRTKRICIFTRRTFCACHFFAKPFLAFFSCQRSAGFFDQARFAQKHITQPGDSMVWPQREVLPEFFSYQFFPGEAHAGLPNNQTRNMLQALLPLSISIQLFSEASVVLQLPATAGSMTLKFFPN